jgi:hypothetical protein
MHQGVRGLLRDGENFRVPAIIVDTDRGLNGAIAQGSNRCTATNAGGSTHAVILNPKQSVPDREHDVSELKELITGVPG